MQRVLVTGGAGFIGSNACNILANEGFEVTALDNLTLGRRDNLSASVNFVEGNCAVQDDLERVGPVEYIIHLAASSSAPMFTEQLAASLVNNILGHTAVLEFARAHKVQKVIFASTSSIYGNNSPPLCEDQVVMPPNFYSVSKHCQEELSSVYQAVYGGEIIGFRFMSVYGLHEEHKGRFANLASQFIWGMEEAKRPVIFGNGRQTRDFTNARDIVRAFMLALRTRKSFGYRIFNVGTGESSNLLELVSIINEVMGTNLSPVLIPNPIASGYVLAQQADLSRIERDLGYSPSVTLEAGIKEIVEHRTSHRIVPRSLSY